MDDEVLELEEVAAWLKLKPSAIYRLTAGKQIPHYVIGRRLRFSRAAVKAWLAEQDVPTRESEGQESRPSAQRSPGNAVPGVKRPLVGVETHAHNGAGKTSSS